jgi:hypothetical protein
VIFIVFLSISGITLNHSVDLELDRRYVSWSWLLDAYGIEVPAPAASFADSGRRATLLGGRLFLDGRDTGHQESVLTGIADLGSLIVIGGEKKVYLLTETGEFVEAIDLAPDLDGPIEQVGRVDTRAVLKTAGAMYSSDPDIAMFEVRNLEAADHWSIATPPSEVEMAALETAWRGRGVTVERLLLDLHSGRVFGSAGPLFMDVVAILLIALSLSGLILSRARNRRR